MGTAQNTNFFAYSSEELTRPTSVEEKRTALRPAPVRELLFRPEIKTVSTNHLEITALRDNPSSVPWGMWGAFTAVAAALAFIAYEGAFGFRSFWMILAAVMVVGFGAMAARYGRRSSLEPMRIAQIDLVNRVLLIDEHPGAQPISLAEVEEVVYAMVKYPVAQTADAIRVQAFTVLLRVGDELVPVIEASPDKNHVFDIARAFAGMTQREITHVGIGVKTA